MKKIQKFMKKNWAFLIIFIIGMIITAASTFYATETIFASSEVSYDNSNSTLTSTNVQDALDELYQKAMEGGGVCQKDYQKIAEAHNTYVCALDTEQKGCEEFSYDSWETIISNVKSNKTYEVGCTKEVTLGNNLGTHTLRVANNTRPSECLTTDFSQTACGFVLEFADIIAAHRMNPYNSNITADGNGSKGGWPATEMRSYLNSTTDTTSIYNSLPTVIQNAIIDTKVVSGHGKDDETNFTSIDKIYLLSMHEVTANGGLRDTAYNSTRQLDYYIGTNGNNSSKAIKTNGTATVSWWWLRSVDSAYRGDFYYISNGGIVPGGDYSYNGGGVSPAFRIV